MDRGASGFRCDVINVIYKTSLAYGEPRVAVTGLEHYKSQEGNHQILKALRREVLARYDCFTVGETVMVDVAEARDLCEPERGELDMLFYFGHLEVDRRVARYIPKPLILFQNLNASISRLFCPLTWPRSLDVAPLRLRLRSSP